MCQASHVLVIDWRLGGRGFPLSRVPIMTCTTHRPNLCFHLQATDLSKLRSEVGRTRADLKVAQSRLALLQQSDMPREDVRKAVSQLAHEKVGIVSH